MAKITINRRCDSCNGSGVIQYYGGPEVQCDACEGSGEILLASFGDQAACFTYQISEATDATEWNALSAGNKDAYAMILSMGIVDLTDGTSIRTTLWAMFDAQSTTRAALITLLGE